MTFKKDDKVVANDVIGTSKLTKGKTYTVLRASATGIQITCDEGSAYEFWSHRFTLAPVLDLTKPVQTKDGARVTLLTTTARGQQPIMGYVGTRESVTAWGIDGSYFRDGSTHPALDLINVPVKPMEQVFFRNIYKEDGKLTMGPRDAVSRKEADDHAASGKSRVGCMKITLVEGQWDN